MSWKGTIGILFGGIAALLAGLETYTLMDDVPNNHITASIRELANGDLGILVLLGAVAAAAGITAHIFPNWGGGKTPPGGHE